MTMAWRVGAMAAACGFLLVAAGAARPPEMKKPPERPEKPYIGLTAKPIYLKSSDGLHGFPMLVVDDVFQSGPAAKAGLAPGDGIEFGEGKSLSSSQDLVDLVWERRIGDVITLHVRRGPQLSLIPLTIEAEPPSFRFIHTDPPPSDDGGKVGVTDGGGPPMNVLPAGTPYIGLGLFDGPIDHPQGGRTGEMGVHVAWVVRRSPGDKAGLLAGDEIERCDGEPVATTDEVVTAVRKHRSGEYVKLTIRRGKTLKHIEFKIEPAPQTLSEYSPR